MCEIRMEDFNSPTHHALLFVLKNDELCVKITNYGAAITAILMKDRNGQVNDIVLGFDTLEGYLKDKGNIYYGATVGRCANRIAKGKFTINGKDYQVAINNGPNHLHGGIDNFSSKFFEYEIQGDTLKLTYFSKDMEEGYPGNLTLDVFCTLKGNQLKMVYHAQSDQDTVCNITNHTYFNLCGEGSGDIGAHLLQIKADQFVGCDSDGLGGELLDVNGTPFDFRMPHPIGERIYDDDIQLKNGCGYDHHFVFNDCHDQVLLREEHSGRQITFSSTQNGAQIYTANWFNEEQGKGNSIYNYRGGVAVECQQMPDAINREGQPSLLKANEEYIQETTYTFEVK